MAKKKPPAKPVPAPLIGGKAQGGQVSTARSSRNPPPHALLNTPTPWVGKVERGSIYEHSPNNGGEFHFLYNPNELSYTYSFNMEMAAPETVAPIPTAGALGGTVLAFEIFLNRQYEVAYEGNSQGVMADIRALEYIVGMKDPSYSYMQMKSLKFVLGKNLVFYGFINNMSARIGLFSEKMVPMFGAVQISATQMPSDFDPRTLFGTTVQQEVSAAVSTGKPVTTAAAAAQVPTRRTGPAIASVH